MSFDPYRTPARPAAEPSPAQRSSSSEVAVVVALVWVLGVMRVAFALARSEAPSRDVDLAWLFVVIAPIVVWKEIGALRRR